MKKGLILAALGTPTSTAISDVRDYLAEFLGDPLVIQYPRWFWLPILHGMILKSRPAKSAELYKKIWTSAGSPLFVYTKMQTEQLQQLLPELDVRFAMTYGKPQIADVIRDLQQSGADDISVLPLYPQYSQTTVEPIVQQVKQVDNQVKILPAFYDNPQYIALLAESIAEKWQSGNYDKVIFSYHGIPKSYVTKGKDPYEVQCQTITQLTVATLGLTENQYEHDYQSKFGPSKWLEPATIQRMAKLPRENVKKILIISPSFVADCLETLYELDIENKATFMENGGEIFDFVHPFNASSKFTEFLRQFTMENSH
ncbi:ferrochelatase [Lactococcus nasutitermitis]|uniref:Coproporphyrin III ferrochelatase n=1 Tax=Lactococcus nasutitermitis TaxID=1652957 RepID=A0ABV9JC56_9LACT|nr:ferrochelatase [Lactococcus nasutitermitis]